MIPKIIHACWMGQSIMPTDQQEYVNHWKKLLPDYEIKVWTDKMFEQYLDDSLFVKESIEKRKYGFFSDYFRFTVLYEFGGIYMDTDVELHKSLNPFLDSKMFMGFIFDSSLGTALYGTEPHNPLMLDWKKILLEDYERKHDFTISNDWITKYFLDHFSDFRLNGKRQSLQCGIEIYPKDYFERYQVDKTSGGGYAEHHCAGTWNDKKYNPWYVRFIKSLLGRRLVSIIGHKLFLPKTPFYSVYKEHSKK